MLVRIKYCIFLPLFLHASYSAASNYNEQALGKLFTTPAERRAIDAKKKGDTQQSLIRSITPSSIKVNGLVIRSNGNSAVWINGRQPKHNETKDSVKVNTKSVSNKDIRIPIMVDGKSIRVKPGQSWSDDTGSVVDNY